MAALRVLATLDQSSRDRIIRPHVIGLSEVTGATIYLLHVVSMVKALTPHAVRSAESYVGAFEKELRAKGVDVHGIVRKGDPVEEIMKVAREYGVDSIVMATRGPRGVDKLLMGSVTKAVFSACPYPITLINEANVHNVVDERVWAQSSYMAHVIWNKVARGLWSEADALADMQRLAALGLDLDVLNATYEGLKLTGSPAEWMDMDFQMETLEAFKPGPPKGESTAA